MKPRCNTLAPYTFLPLSLKRPVSEPHASARLGDRPLVPVKYLSGHVPTARYTPVRWH